MKQKEFIIENNFKNYEELDDKKLENFYSKLTLIDQKS